MKTGKVIEAGANGKHIIRVNHDANTPFLVVSKATVRDDSLTFADRGFLLYLLCQPDTWRVRPEQIAKETGIGRGTVYRHLDRLKNAGYVEYEEQRRQADNGRWQCAGTYTVFECKKDKPLKTDPIGWPDGTLNGETIPF